MIKYFWLFPLLMIISITATSFAQAQSAATLSGFVRDRSTGETLPFVNIYITEEKTGSATNLEGYYVVAKIPEGIYTVKVSLIGYSTESFSIDTHREKNIVRNIALTSKPVQEDEVLVTAERAEQRSSTQTGRIIMKAQDLVSLPAIGEADIFRALQTMPGVKAVSEISSGLFVRGGSSDQNLILLDGTVVYNPSHLFGFLSTFNNDAIKDVELMKGGFPAEYGGRLSSVLNITNIDGNQNEFHGKGSVSLISTRLTGEGPLGNGSWFLSGRRTYFDTFIKAAGLDTGDNPIPLYYFYDANAKITQSFGQDDRVSIVSYLGQDDLTFNLQSDLNLNMRWGNRTISGKWTHLFSPTVFANFYATYSQYDASTNFDFGGFTMHEENGIKDYSLKGDITFYPANEHLVKLGIWWSQYRITYLERMGEGDEYRFLERPAQFSLYAQNEWTLSPLIILQGGLRGEYQDASRTATLGPRFAGRYNMTENTTAKFATGIYYQFLNAVPAGGRDGGFSPFDIWVPINKRMKPPRSIDVVGGIETQFGDATTGSIETYFKKYKNILYWIGQATRTTHVDELFYVGTGRAFGLELFLQRRYGSLTGSLGYSLSWTYLTFPEVNTGKEYQPKYDRRHDISVVANYEITDRWKVGAIYTYATGQGYTLGIARYTIRIPEQEFTEVMAGEIYNHRLAPYYRLDLSVTKKASLFGIEGSWFIQIYNVLNHRNVWFKEFDTSENPTKVTNVKLLPIIPTFGFDFRF